MQSNSWSLFMCWHGVQSCRYLLRDTILWTSQQQWLFWHQSSPESHSFLIFLSLYLCFLVIAFSGMVLQLFWVCFILLGQQAIPAGNSPCLHGSLCVFWQHSFPSACTHHTHPPTYQEQNLMESIPAAYCWVHSSWKTLETNEIRT